MTAPTWLPALLAEHDLVMSDFISVIGKCTANDCDWMRSGFSAAKITDAHRAHVAAVAWAEFTARAEQAREDVAEAIRTAALPSWLRDADAAIAALLRAMGGAL